MTYPRVAPVTPSTDSAGEGRPDHLSVTPTVGAAHIIEAAVALVCAALASAIVVTAIALVFL